MQFDSQDYKYGIENKGFRKVITTSGKDEKYQLIINNKYTPITTYASKGKKPVSKKIRGKMKRQLWLHRLSQKYSVEAFLKCNPSYKEYIKKLFEAKILTKIDDKIKLIPHR